MIAPLGHSPQVDEVVHLTVDIPDLGLRSGQGGSVCSTWFSPATAYEVEFQPPGLSCPVRALLLEEQIALDEPEEAPGSC